MKRHATGKYAEHAAARMSALADLVADGVTIKAAAAQLGFSENVGTKYWRRIRDSLGWQAQ